MAPTRRRPLRSVTHSNLRPPPLKMQLMRAATSPTAKTVYMTVGLAGLAALSLALFGPKRFNRQVVQPVRVAMGDQAERIWSESRPLREQIGKLFERAQSESGRERLVRSF